MKQSFYILIMSLIVVLTACEKEGSNTVQYVVNCSPSGFDITYTNSSGNTEQKTISSTSWSTSFEGTSGDFVYISAQANNENATVTTEIYYGGEKIETATSTGDYVIATASGSIP